MKTNKLSQSFAVLVMFLAMVAPLRAQWNQSTGTGSYVYTDPANWVGGIINNVFTNPGPSSGITLVFTNDFILTNGLLMNFSGNSNVTFQSDSATPRTLHISLGHFLRTNQSGGTITIGTTNNPLVLDLYNSTWTIGGQGSGSLSSGDATMNVYAKITDLAGGTNGVNLALGRVYTYLLNDSNDFVGPVSFAGLRGGGFTSIKNIGAGASAMGAPTDITNGTITVVDNTSFGHVDYLGKGDTTDRPFVWNLTGSQYSFQNLGSGKLTFTGPWTLPYAANRTLALSVNAVSNPIELDGFLNESSAYLNGSAPTLTNLVFKGGWNTNRITLTCPTNNFMALELTNVVLAFNSISNAGLPCALGTNGVIVHRGNTTASGGFNPYGQGASLQYFGPTASFSRTVQFTGSGYDWGIDNAGTNTTLTFSSDFTIAYTGGGATARYFFFNPNAVNATSFATIEVQSVIPDIAQGATVVAGSPAGYTINNGGVLRLLNPNNAFSAGVQVKYARTLQAMSLADSGTPCSLGTAGGLYPSGLTAINLGSTDSQRGGTLAYIGTNNASCNRQITILGLGALSGGTLLNNSPNNSSMHFSDTGSMQFNPGIAHCILTLGGSAQATNVLDEIIPNVPTNLTSLVVQGSIWKLTAAETYSDTTTITNGALLVGGTIGPAADVTVQNGGVLGGNGTINANVNILANGTVSPGASIGVLAVNGNLTNNGTLYMELNKQAGTNDQVVGLNTLVYGGTLAVTNLAGSLAVNDSFKLFTAASYLGSFTSVSPATPGSGLAWDLTGLTNGVLKVIAGASAPPRISSVHLYGSSLVISGTNGTQGATAYVVASTNVQQAPNLWLPVKTNTFDLNGAISFTNNINLAIPQQFFRLKLP
jgi:hypothetical protein